MLELIQNFIINMAHSGKLPDSFQYEFVINAFICSLFIGPILGTVGTMIIIKKMAFFSEAVGHAAMTGIALGIVLGEPSSAPYISLFSYCIIFALIINYTKNRTKISSDTLIGVFLSISIALGGSLLIIVSGKVNSHILENILFGSVLTVNKTDIYLLVLSSLILIMILSFFFNKMLLASFNPNLALVRGVNVKLTEYIFIILVTIITISSVKIVGSILVEALLLIPAASARNISRSIRSFIGYSILFALFSCVLGIMLPIQLSLQIPSGSMIILISAVIFLITIITKTCTARFKEGD